MAESAPTDIFVFDAEAEGHTIHVNGAYSGSAMNTSSFCRLATSSLAFRFVSPSSRAGDVQACWLLYLVCNVVHLDFLAYLGAGVFSPSLVIVRTSDTITCQPVCSGNSPA
jgi:hypothetical protein